VLIILMTSEGVETMTSHTIRVVLIEPQELVRVGAKSPNLVILNLDLPQMGGLEIVQVLKQHHSKIKIMVLTANRDPEMMMPAFDAGVDSYCLQHHPIGLITTALQQTHQGNHWIDPAIAHHLINRRSSPPSAAPEVPPMDQLFDESWQMVEHLTTREVAVLELVAKGLTNKQIADQLYIGSGTVKSHVSSLMQKFGARSRTEAASRALESGILNQYRRNLA
jgi:two-component system, NarL family, response regulator LiaR